MNKEWVKNNLMWLAPVVLSTLGAIGTGISYSTNSFIEYEQSAGYEKARKYFQSEIDTLENEKLEIYEKYNRSMLDAMRLRIKLEHCEGSESTNSNDERWDL
tara:strand:+ start:1094 stop:1399 length:306 start_codon:yes stop_codon:yes gene_type:complete